MDYTDYYVYVYLDPRKEGKYEYNHICFLYEPFYVGKGRRYRYREHLYEAYNFKDANKHKCRIIRLIKSILNIEPYILKLHENINDIQSINLEEHYINMIGKIHTGTGHLTNYAERMCIMSGAAHPNYGKPRPQNIKDKIRKSLLGNKLSDSTKEKLRNNMLGKPKSKEHSSNISKGKRGIATVHHDTQTRKKISDSQRGIKHHHSKHIIFIDPNGKKYEIYSNFYDFLKNHNLNISVVKNYINKGKIPPPTGNRYGEPRINTTGWEVIIPSQ